MRKLVLAAVVLVITTSRESRADGAFYGLFGAGTGSDFTALSEESLDLETALKESPIFGARVGAYSFPIGFEGSLSYSRAALEGGAFDGVIEGRTNIFYAEANVLIIILPGPVAPFVTGGVGLHYLDFEIVDFANFGEARFGYNFGGGLKLDVSALALRVDVRDHVTTFGLDNFGFGIIGGVLGLAGTDARIHNVEISFGIGFNF